MNQRICDRCLKCLEPYKTRLLRTKEIRTEAYLQPLRPPSLEIHYDLCPDCKALFLDFMEGEAIPPLNTEQKGDIRNAL